MLQSWQHQVHEFMLPYSKRKQRRQREKSVSKQKLLKVCHQCQNVTVLAILECLEFKNVSVFHDSYTLKSISLDLCYYVITVKILFLFLSSSVAFLVILIFWSCFLSQKIMKLTPNFIQWLTLTWKSLWAVQNVCSLGGRGGVCKMAGKNEKRECGWFNTSSGI